MSRALLTALAETVLPAGQILPGAGASTVDRVEALVAELPESLAAGYRGLLRALDLHSRARFGGHFADLPLGTRLKVLDSWGSVEATRLGLRGLISPIKLAYFDDPSVYAALGCRFAVDRPETIERTRADAQIIEGRALDGDLECDVVVVGTGAGGAPMAWELAKRGFAVLLLEEGERYTRKDFSGRPVEMLKKLYRKGGATLAFGNTAIPIPVGRAVGGTTLINSGTCFRVPESTKRQWQDEHGLEDLGLDPYYDVAEEIIGVGPSSKKALGKPAELIARGCDALGYSHHPLMRNAPGCDGQGLCCFGCPSDAKRSTNVSFVPLALERGAQLVTGMKVDRILTSGRSATGVSGLVGEGKRIDVRAKAVVIACGTLHTPALLEQNGLCKSSRMLGRNLSIHPATSAIARFAEPVNSWSTVPQGYAIDEFKSEGLLFEGSSTPLDITGVSLTGFGPSYVAQMEDFNRTLGFGFMVKDTSRGKVTAKKGEPKISYWLGDRDLALMQRGMGILARVFFAAGAEEVYAPVAGFERLRSLADVDRLERASITARKMDITAYHPLGTAKMGTDALSSVVDRTHETWDVHNLFIADGSAVPGSLGVNPQLTIMAMSLRAAEYVSRRIDALSRAAA